MVVRAVGAVAPVASGQGGVTVVDSGVDVGDDDALAVLAEVVPDLGGADPVDVPFHALDGVHPAAGGGVREDERFVLLDRGDFGARGDLPGEVLVAGHLERVGNPVRRVGRAGLLEQGHDCGLTPAGFGLLGRDDGAAPVGLLLLLACGGGVGLLAELDPEGDPVLGVELNAHRTVGLLCVRARLGRGGGRRGQHPHQWQAHDTREQGCDDGAPS